MKRVTILFPACLCCNVLYQGSPNVLNKGSVYCTSDFRGAGLWPLGKENVPMSVGVNNAIIGVGGKNNALLFGVSGRNSVPHWCQ